MSEPLTLREFITSEVNRIIAERAELEDLRRQLVEEREKNERTLKLGCKLANHLLGEFASTGERRS